MKRHLSKMSFHQLELPVTKSDVNLFDSSDLAPTIVSGSVEQYLFELLFTFTSLTLVIKIKPFMFLFIYLFLVLIVVANRRKLYNSVYNECLQNFCFSSTWLQQDSLPGRQVGLPTFNSPVKTYYLFNCD